MTKFLVERHFHVGQDQMDEVGRRSKQVATASTKHPRRKMVRRHADLLGFHKVVGVFEIAGDVTPDDFPLN